VNTITAIGFAITGYGSSISRSGSVGFSPFKREEVLETDLPSHDRQCRHNGLRLAGSKELAFA
jgi:hypothetical protein